MSAKTITLTKSFPVIAHGQTFGAVTARFEAIASTGEIAAVYMSPSGMADPDWIEVSTDPYRVPTGHHNCPFVRAVLDGSRLLSTIRELQRRATHHEPVASDPFRAPIETVVPMQSR